ncbi:hypothetical protein C0995_001717 [Termitomyces sp. Mi166|nr:hypothetical protein C0995_001717 [Termitomyces sp. Mi166\
MSFTDYIIVGGGLTGTALAVRLSEDPNVTVTIIEAGGDTFHDDVIDIPAIAKLGAAQGWGWDDLLPFFLKSETFTYSEDDAKKYGMKFDARFRGVSGPVQRTIPRSMDGVVLPWIESLKGRGLEYNTDPNDGDNTGLWLSTKTIDTRSVRSSSASAYYEPHQSRSNLNVVANAQATRILTFGRDSVLATGVEYIKDGSLHVIEAKKEVILCCGSYKTPQLLELSGIGDPKDHITAIFTAKLKAGHESFESMTDPAFAKRQKDIYKTTGSGMLVSSGIPTGAAFLSFRDFDDDGSIAKSVDGLSLPDISTYNTQKEWVENDRVSFIEAVPGSIANQEPGATYMSSGIILLHPFNRGSVHIASKDPTASPMIDPNFLSNETDLKILIKGYRILREVFRTEPLSSLIEGEILPGEDIETDEDLVEYLRKTVGTTFHPIATASMLPQEEGGCVDAQLKVYGTANLRVVDASIIPINLSTHLQATLYAIAEKFSIQAADMIKSDRDNWL